MAQFSIIEFVLRDLLQVSADLIRDYASVQEQLLYLVLIPHAILLLFIYIFADGISRMAIPGPNPHKGFKVLFGIVAYISIIMAGWYGQTLLPIFLLWWQIMLILGLGYFVLSALIHPSMAADVVRLGGAVGGKMGAKGKANKKYKKELRITEEQIARIAPYAGTNYMYDAELARLRAKKAELEALLAS
jgi:hypothetical protein